MAKEKTEPKLSKLQQLQIKYGNTARELAKTQTYEVKLQQQLNLLNVEINKLEGK